MPAYSCGFNSIERVWGTAKVTIRKKIMMEKEEITKERFKKMILEIFEEIGQESLIKMCGANQNYLAKILTMS